MKHPARLRPSIVALTLTLAACTGGDGSGGGGGAMTIVRVSSGFGELLPYKIFAVSADGTPSNNLVSIRSLDDLADNVTFSNPVLPTPTLGDTATLPDGTPGNQFLYATFSKPLELDSVLSALPGAQSDNGMTGAITVEARDPLSGGVAIIPGRAFIDGWTYAGDPTGDPLRLPLQRWVSLQEGMTVAEEVEGAFPGAGFPGVGGAFSGSTDLVSSRTLVFVIDSDGDLSTHERFPSDRLIRMRIGTGVRDTSGRNLSESGLASTTVGANTISPEVAVTPPPNSFPEVIPGNGDDDVDPLTTIDVQFTEPVQPLTLGDLPSDGPPNLSAALLIQFGPPAQRVTVPSEILPLSIYDFSRWEVLPSFNFPGEGPADEECGVFNRVDVTVNPNQLQDLSGNFNLLAATTFFETGPGPGLVNAPVAPDAIYVGRAGAESGISVIDLNGFGAGTGNPTYDDTGNTISEGDSNYPNNPNVRLQGAIMRPPLVPPVCTVKGGSQGVFTLTKDSTLDDLVVRSPVVLSVGDMMLGHGLDGSFNNGPAPFGCQGGGGNLCALPGLKLYQVIHGGPNTLIPPILNNPILNSVTGGENVISWAPHPNPPPLQFPPLCLSPFIGGQEPTAIDTLLSPTGNVWGPPCANCPALTNLLVPGDPFGDPHQVPPQPPSGLLSQEQNSFFEGPSPPAQTLGGCFNYMIRQQVGQFLYVIDRGRNEVMVLNSNRMTVIDRIVLPDPTSLAMSPNIDFLAVTNQNVDLVSFIDINPASATFHQVTTQTVVGSGPNGIAWEPGNEDILVCNEGDDTMSIISAFTLEQRKVVSSQLDRPFDVAITNRQAGFGFFRNVYFAYVLNRSGRIAMFESGPNGVNGWGYDDIVGVASQEFKNPKAIQPDHINIGSAVWIAHEGPIDTETQDSGSYGEPAVSNLRIDSAIMGQLPLNVNSLLIPNFRDMAMQVDVSLGPNELSGIPVSLAFDNMRNFGGLTTFQTFYSAGIPAQVNGKSLVRTTQQIVNTSEPEFMFVAVPNPSVGSEGLVDVIDIGGGFLRVDTNAFHAGVQSIEVQNAIVLMDYFRQ
ncbi:MAG: beta-propeller fold lactonase family protein [Planctomycetota bacterium]|nr:beta-propeller fold lactonase family protein [Planctomycetota bacterium]